MWWGDYYLNIPIGVNTSLEYMAFGLMNHSVWEKDKYINWYAGAMMRNYYVQYGALETDYQDINPYWDQCFICTLPYSPQKSVIIVLSGLCKGLTLTRSIRWTMMTEDF